jgi:hypothetical protein
MYEYESNRKKILELHKNDPRWKLWAMVKQYKVMTTSKVFIYERDPLYSRYDTDQFDIISRAIKMSNAYGLFDNPETNHPAIIAIQPRVSEPPYYYYIRDDVIKFRKNKPSVKPKRKIIKKKSCGCK